jgi:hypothetical protein
MRSFAVYGFLFATVLVGCGASVAHDAAKSYSPAAGTASADSPAGVPEAPMEAKASRNMATSVGKSGDVQLASQQKSVISNRMVIRTAELALRVDNVEKTEREVQRIVTDIGGYVDNASSSDLDSDHPILSLSMRVPSQSFDEAMTKIEGLGVRTSKSITSQDVTEQVVDLDARIKSMLAQEETFRGMLRKATRMEDVINLQQQLTNLRGEIESMLGQRASLAKQASLSTISLTLQQGAVIHQQPKDPNWLGQTWAESTNEMGGLLRTLASLCIWFAVFSPLWVPVLWLVMRAIKSSLPKKHIAEA